MLGLAIEEAGLLPLLPIQLNKDLLGVGGSGLFWGGLLEKVRCLDLECFDQNLPAVEMEVP